MTASMSMLVFALGVTLLAVCAYLALRFVLSYYRFLTNPYLKKLPGPTDRKTYLVGWAASNLKSQYMENHLKWYNEALEKVGGDRSKVPLVACNIFFGSVSLIPMSPDLVQAILSHPAHRDPPRYQKPYKRFIEVAGYGLITSTGSYWQRHRRILQPSFHANSFRDAMTEAVPRCIHRLLGAWKKRMALQQQQRQQQQPEEKSMKITAYEQMAFLTLDIFGQVTLSHEFDTLEVVEDWANTRSDQMGEAKDPLVQSFNALAGAQNLLPIALQVLNISWLEKYISPKFAFFLNQLDMQVDKVIQRARDNRQQKVEAEPSSSQPAAHKKPKTLLEVTLETIDLEGSQDDDKKLSDKELRAEMKTLLLAGHETTATMMTYVLYSLAKYPDVQERVYQDVCQHSKSDEDITAESVEKMKYLVAFLHEVLRMFPPVPVFSRHTTQEEDWMGHKVPGKARIMIPVFWMHRHPDHWDQPLEFRPERWLEDGPDGLPRIKQQRHKFTFIPFAAGGHNCIGQRFAMLEGELCVALLVRNMIFSLPEHLRDQTLRMYGLVTLKSDPVVEILVKAR